ncbi:MAG: energy transducer TonB [Bacteroidales bacterium]|jgi:protein TonB
MNRHLLIIVLFLIKVAAYSQTAATHENSTKPDTLDGMKVYTNAEYMPEFPGGQAKLYQYVYGNIKVPAAKKGDVMQSKIRVSFVIDTAGHIRNPYIVNPLTPDKLTHLEDQVLQAIKGMPKWKAATDDGKKVPARFTLPFNISWQ